MQSSSQRLKPNGQGHDSQSSNNRVSATDRRALRIRKCLPKGTSQQLDQHQTQDEQVTNSGGHLFKSNVPSRGLIQGLRRSSRLKASRPKSEIRERSSESRLPSGLGSEYLPVEELLGKRIRMRGLGRITEYLVKFKVYDGNCDMWTAAQNLPKNVMDD
ncbi:hypothetical protein J3458_002648 [Metarhizium acridum]|uniref:uncharacterized protein n=1 Tax=Metarhizium acridum TaxID=92637 RepID=UPI001C6CE4E4|nr:hypothetical protein J3458_002648 [Metarhizium acridum]